MNIEKYDTDKLRKIIRNLQEENNGLKEKLKNADIPFETVDCFEIDETEDRYDIDQAERVLDKEINKEDARLFYSIFWGRPDVYAKRHKSGNYFPQCDNRWNDSCPIQNGKAKFCDKDCTFRNWKRIDGWTIIRHLKGEKEDGSDVLGTYPLFPDGTCKFIVFDFDNHEKGSVSEDYANKDNEYKDEVNALRKICEINSIDHLVERSRSGKGAHLWIFFDAPISAKLARNFGFLLLDKGMSYVNLRSFNYYDRMYPSQDVSAGIGNLIALPLQGSAVKNGNSVFVDDDWNAYPDQWEVIRNVKRLTKDDITDKMAKWQAELAEEKGMLTDPGFTERLMPWKRNDRFSKEDVVGKLHITLGDGIYIDTLNLMPRLQNQIKSLAVFDNPEYYRKKAMGYSTYYYFRTIYLAQDINGYIKMPRGLREKIIEECKRGKIEFDITDRREKGRPIRAYFKGDLRAKQDLAADDMFSYENGILDAATSFGKTVVASYLISKRKVNTLIILQNTELIDQWHAKLNEFLEIREKLPEYETKTGRKKTRSDLIGILQGNKDTLTGIVDIAMVGSLFHKGNYHEMINSYGMVIIDECHHSAASTFVSVLNKINAKYIYGFTGTVKRSDNLEKMVFMMIGPVRHRYTALERAMDTGIEHFIVPRFTRVVDFGQCKDNISKAYELVCYNRERNSQIISDVKECIVNRLTPLILTRFKEHARHLYEELKDSADNVLLIYGDNSNKENKEMIRRLNSISDEESVIVVATGKKIGEGFDYPRFDTLILAAPVSAENLVNQYAGRIDRIYKNKNTVYVYDYVDIHIPVFDNMYKKRLKTYKKIGFNIFEGTIKEKQNVKAIYDSGNYSEIFENDLIEAEKRVVISSPQISKDKVERLLFVMRPKQEEGIEITVITNDPDNNRISSAESSYEMISEMRNAGINVVLKEEVEECFALIDDELVWHGGVNLLGKEDVWDNLMRIKDEKAAIELAEISIKNNNETLQ